MKEKINKGIQLNQQLLENTIKKGIGKGDVKTCSRGDLHRSLPRV